MPRRGKGATGKGATGKGATGKGATGNRGIGYLFKGATGKGATGNRHRLQCMGTKKTATIFFGFLKNTRCFAFLYQKNKKEHI